MVDAEWPSKCTKKIGIRTHRNKTPVFIFEDTEIPIIERQKRIYEDFCMKPVPYTIVRHERFDEVNGAKVVAIRDIPKNIVLFELCGQLYVVSDQFVIPGVNDFSTVTSSINDKDYMFLGPVAFINHDCSPNVQWHSRSKSLSCVRTIKNIPANDEILVFYGPNFFAVSMDLILQDAVKQPTEREIFDIENSDNGDDDDSIVITIINDNAYQCDQCQRTFKFQSWYTNHKTTHSVVGIHQCNYCPKTFKRKDNLKRHFLSHFGTLIIIINTATPANLKIQGINSTTRM
ncbi:hypothetical protein ACI65C_013349 [Semiaphis heraclei]